MLKVWAAFLAALLLVVGGVVIYNRSRGQSSPISNITQAISNPVDQIKSSPFYDLTIPYLREKEYKSQLGKMEKLSETSEFTSFLTSFTSDGFKVNGLLTQPKGVMPEGGWPGIVFIHGYIPPSTYVTTQKYEDYVNFLARSGFVVFKIDLRGHGNSEGEAGGGYFSPDYVVDTLNAYSALASSSMVNPKKIGLWGHSMSGNVVLRALAAKPEIPAATIWAGAGYSYTDLAKYGISDNSYRPPEDTQRNQERAQKRKEMTDIYGQPSQDSLFWRLVAPTNYLKDLKGAIELHHAQDDNVVNIGYSRDLDALLTQNNVPHLFYEYPAGGHNINSSSFATAMQRTSDFFKKYLN